MVEVSHHGRRRLTTQVLKTGGDPQTRSYPCFRASCLLPLRTTHHSFERASEGVGSQGGRRQTDLYSKGKVHINQLERSETSETWCSRVRADLLKPLCEQIGQSGLVAMTHGPRGSHTDPHVSPSGSHEPLPALQWPQMSAPGVDPYDTTSRGASFTTDFSKTTGPAFEPVSI